ncbi:NAD(P)H-dependent oxidoreductase [Eubacteriaceae bacterium ES2]|nr:NAD(P)H-dependent oxidoreductase [Eubacteriaceae bacterium ES2]
MKIAVCNGSPKGEKSITLQHIKYLEKRFTKIDFVIFNIAKQISKLEKDAKYFDTFMVEIGNADAVIWSFGLWVLSVPAQMLRFFELIQERGMTSLLKDKYTGILSTSIHYFDNCARDTVWGICEDFGMQVADAICFHMDDIRQVSQQQNLEQFGLNIIRAVGEKQTFSRRYHLLEQLGFKYKPSLLETKISVKGKRILILKDSSDPDTNLAKMIAAFQNCFTEAIEVIDLNDIDIKGACMGCMKCGYDYTCVYKDGFTEFYNKMVRSADIIVHAGQMKGRYLSSLWKTFFDRAFFWNHTPSLQGKQLAYLISGPISQNENLVQVLEAQAQARQHASHAGIVSDEVGDSKLLSQQIFTLAQRLVTFSEAAYIRPETFLGTGGWMIFRDEIYSGIRMVWQADHRYYRQHGYYNFPNKNIFRKWTMDVFSVFVRIPAFRKKFYGMLNDVPIKRMDGKKIAEAAKDRPIY